MKQVASLVQQFTHEEIAKILDGEDMVVSYDGGEIALSEGDLAVQRTEKENVKVLNEGNITVGYDTEITEELLLEGIARDIVRVIQQERKENDFQVTDHIHTEIDGDDVIEKAVSSFADYISKETLSDELLFQKNEGKRIEVDESVITLSLSRK